MKFAEKVADITAKGVAALVSAGTIVGALEAIGKSGDLVGLLVKTGITTFTDSINLYASAVSSMRDAAGIVNNLEAFPGGAWPQAVS